MKALVIGSGGREHALARALAASPRVREVAVAPGNAGMTDVARVVPAPGGAASLAAVALDEAPDLVVIGPEAPLVDGLADLLRAAGLAVFGPGAAAARLEGSKAWSKRFMERHGVPTAAFASFRDEAGALAHLERAGAPIVVKDSALAAGKGVTVATDAAAAAAAVRAVFRDPAGAPRPGAEVVIEEALVGQEVSLLVVTDGETARVLPLAQDYKQAFDGDAGPMTGGMGVIAPVPPLRGAEPGALLERVVEPTLAGLRADGLDYRGVLFIGLMVAPDGEAKVLEYNVRFGDPETQALLPLLDGDPLELLLAAAEGRLAGHEPAWSGRAAACVVLAAPGYPSEPARGVPLRVPDDLPEGVHVLHAGTARDADGRLVSAGGRVLNVVGVADDLAAARARAYAAVDRIGFPGARLRRDIGARLLGPAGGGAGEGAG